MDMDDEAEHKPNADEIWPPSLTLLPPVKPRELPWLVRLPLWGLVLVDMGFGLIIAAVNCLDRWFRHHTFRWDDPAIDGISMFVVFFALHLWLRSAFLKNDLEKCVAWEAAEQERPTQDATK